MRLWLFAVLGCLGCAGSGAKPTVARAVAAAPAEASNIERRPYAELTEPSAADAADSPGVWLQVTSAAQLVSKLPASIQAEPLMQRFKELTWLVSNDGAPTVQVKP